MDPFYFSNSKNGLRSQDRSFLIAKKLFILQGGECFLLPAIHPF
jgi:hypothetical protein